MRGALDTFNRVELLVYWKDSRSVQRMGEPTILDDFTGIKKDLDKSVFAAFPLEIAYRVAHENEPSHELYATLLTGLESLAVWRGDPRLHTAWHALQVISVAGFAPAVLACAACGREVSHARGFSYDGGVTCGSCRGDRSLSAKGYQTLRALSAGREGCPPDAGATIEAGREVFDLLAEYAARQLDVGFRSLRVIREVCDE
jgi:DNA repair protein RecO (recombination protein O)